MKSLNYNIVPFMIEGDIDIKKDLCRKIENLLISYGVKKLESSYLSNTSENLLYGLFPSYNPLYRNEELILNEVNSNFKKKFNAIDLKIIDFLSQKYDCNFDNIYNNFSLISQFSGKLIRYYIENKDLRNFFILSKLFRRQKLKREYFQLEVGIVGKDIIEIIAFIEKFLNNLFNKKVKLIKIYPKFFYFVSIGFEFEFLIEKDLKKHRINLVGGFLDKTLLEKFGIKENIFIFGVTIDKFLKLNYDNLSLENKFKKQIVNGTEVVLGNDIDKIISNFEIGCNLDECVLINNKLIIEPKNPEKLYIYNKFILSNILEKRENKLDYMDLINIHLIHPTKLFLKGKVEEVFFIEALIFHIKHWFNGSVTYNNNELIIYTKDVNINRLAKGLGLIEKDRFNKIYISKEDFEVYLGQKAYREFLDCYSCFSFHGIESYKIYDKGLIFKIPSYRIDINGKEDILHYLLSLYLRKKFLECNNDKNSSFSKVQSISTRNVYNILRDEHFFLYNGFNEINFSVRASYDINDNDLDDIFGYKEKIERWGYTDNTLLFQMIKFVTKENRKKPVKYFGSEYLITSKGENKHFICSLILNKFNGNYFNYLYSIIYTFFKKREKEIKIFPKDFLFLEEGKSFSIVLDDKIIGYFGVLNEKYFRKRGVKIGKGVYLVAEFLF